MTFNLNPKHIQQFTLAPICNFIYSRRGRELGMVAVYMEPSTAV